MGVKSVVPAVERPDLADAASALDQQWPPFMLKDPHSNEYMENLDAFVDWTWFVVDSETSQALLARILTVPISWKRPLDELPDRGWDEAIELAVRGHWRNWHPTVLVVLEITLAPQARGQGLSVLCLEHLRAVALERGLTHVLAPVRPTSKVEHPAEPMGSFLARTRADGLSSDPWIRTHQQLGARLVKIAPMSMTIVGTFKDWQEWTQVDLSESETATAVVGGLVPVLIDHNNRIGVYVEPNVWMSHDVRPGRSG